MTCTTYCMSRPRRCFPEVVSRRAAIIVRLQPGDTVPPVVSPQQPQKAAKAGKAEPSGNALMVSSYPLPARENSESTAKSRYEDSKAAASTSVRGFGGPPFCPLSFFSVEIAIDDIPKPLPHFSVLRAVSPCRRRSDGSESEVSTRRQPRSQREALFG